MIAKDININQHVEHIDTLMQQLFVVLNSLVSFRQIFLTKTVIIASAIEDTHQIIYQEVILFFLSILQHQSELFCLFQRLVEVVVIDIVFNLLTPGEIILHLIVLFIHMLTIIANGYIKLIIIVTLKIDINNIR